MITFDTSRTTPWGVLIARVLGPFGLVASYVFGRVYPAVNDRIPIAEAGVMTLVLMGLVLVGLVAAGDLAVRIRDARDPGLDSDALEVTATIAPITDVDTVVARACAAETRRLDALLGVDAPDLNAFERRRRALVEDTEPYDLFTHEFHPQHHTPPGGFRIHDEIVWPEGPFRLARPDLLPPEIFIPNAPTTIHRATGRLPSPHPRDGGRHAKTEG